MTSKWRLCLLFVLVTLSNSVGSAQDKAKQPSASTNGSAWRSNGEQWTRTSDYTIDGYASRPDASTLQSILVHWDQPTVDPLGNFCTIRGQLQIPSGNGEQTQPIEWFQGVIVYMAMHSDTKLDWSQGTNEQDSLEHSEVVGGSGRFEVLIDLRKSARDRKIEQPFQFGVALAKHTDLKYKRQRVVWSSSVPVVASSIRMLKVPAAPPLSHEVELINRAAGWPFQNPDGVALINAVNALQKLPKEEALRVLEEFVALSDNFDYFEDQEIPFWIIRLLFEPIRLGDRIPSPAIAVYLVDGNSADGSLWQLDPIELVDDIPFMAGMRTGASGISEHPSSHIEWARRHGVIRDTPLNPTSNPQIAADKLLNSRKFARLHENMKRYVTGSIRSQALAMLLSSAKPVPRRYRDRTVEQSEWAEQMSRVSKLEIKWDDVAGRFVTTQPDN